MRYKIGTRSHPDVGKRVEIPPSIMHTYEVELTDTFGGEANYSWVRRAEVSVPDWDGNGRPKGYQQTLMRRAKAAVGLTGVRGVTSDYGDMIEFRPYGACVVMFVTFKDA